VPQVVPSPVRCGLGFREMALPLGIAFGMSPTAGMWGRLLGSCSRQGQPQQEMSLLFL